MLQQLVTLLALCSACAHLRAAGSSIELHDPSRNRRIPLELHEPAAEACTAQCKVVLFGTGYRAMPSDYSFLLEALSKMGYFVIALQHDLPSDARMPSTGNTAKDRTPFWEDGVASIHYVARELSSRLKSTDWSSLTLVGHSNGGDIAALYASKPGNRVRELITLDNRRVPLPSSAAISVLSIRSSDQPADPGVLPTNESTKEQSVCVVHLKATKHDDMNNSASPASKRAMVSAITKFLVEGSCERGS